MSREIKFGVGLSAFLIGLGMLIELFIEHVRVQITWLP
jgi:hypothetical protein